MRWNDLTQPSQVQTLTELSFREPVVVFKHSTRCSISSMAKARLDREEHGLQGQFFYLDLLKHRDISNVIAEKFDVHHESPQVILLSKGECVYDASHNAITVSELKEQLERYSS